MQKACSSKDEVREEGWRILWSWIIRLIVGKQNINNFVVQNLILFCALFNFRNLLGFDCSVIDELHCNSTYIWFAKLRFQRKVGVLSPGRLIRILRLAWPPFTYLYSYKSFIWVKFTRLHICQFMTIYILS